MADAVQGSVVPASVKNIGKGKGSSWNDAESLAIRPAAVLVGSGVAKGAQLSAEDSQRGVKKDFVQLPRGRRTFSHA